MSEVFCACVYVLKRAFIHDKRLLWVLTGSIIISGITPYMYMIIMAYIIGNVGDRTDIDRAVLTVLLLIAITFLLNVAKAFLGNVQVPLLNDYRQSEKRELSRKALSRPFQKIETAEFWDAYQKAQLSVRRNFAGNEGLLRNVIELCIRVVPFLGAMIAIRELDAMIIGIILVVASAGNFMASFAEKMTHRSEIHLSGIRAEADRFILILFHLDYQKDIRVCRAGKMILGKYSAATDKIVREESAICRKNFRIRWATGTLLAVQDIVIYLILIFRYKDNQFEVAEWTLLISAMTMITYELANISSLLSQMKSNADFVCEFRQFIEDQEGEQRYKKDVEITAGNPILSLRDVEFCYEDYQALKKINLEINKGERIAIVGLNGAGKSTLIKLLVGLYQPSSGDVVFMGRRTSDYGRDEYYRHFACLFQEINTYPFSLLTNVSLKNEAETDADRVLALLQELSDEDFVDKLPKREHTVLSRVLDKKGIELSGGQKQMVSLCRAFYRDLEVLVLDEPTAALDPIAEKHIFEKIDQIAKGKTVIYVSHRLVSTMFCDKIVLLQEESVQESGSHEQLMSNDGVYAELYRMQTSYYTACDS